MVASSGTLEDALVSARLKLRRDLNKWRKTQLDLYPQLADELDGVDVAQPEHEKLLIPSDFSDAQRRSLRIDMLAKVEYALCEGQAHDALDKVRLAIQTFNYNVKFKVDNVRGQGPNTRAQQFLSTPSQDKVKTTYSFSPLTCIQVSLRPFSFQTGIGILHYDIQHFPARPQHNIRQPLYTSHLTLRAENIKYIYNSK